MRGLGQEKKNKDYDRKRAKKEVLCRLLLSHEIRPRALTS